LSESHRSLPEHPKSTREFHRKRQSKPSVPGMNLVMK
jgi:hypothetical protein